MREHLLDEVLADEALALETALHVREDEQDRVDRAVADGPLQLFDVHPLSSDSADVIAANSSSGAEETR